MSPATDLRMVRSTARRAGFTLVELLVVIAIIGILVALLLPAVQAARESARVVECKNHLKQLGLAFLVHVDTHGHMPTGGWGFQWWGDPDRGAGRRQHGGWGYNVLPFVEQTTLYAMGAGLDENSQQKKELIAKRVGIPVPGFYCPSRRKGLAYPFFFTSYPINAARVTVTAKTDYCVNVGDRGGHTERGPSSLAFGDSSQFQGKTRLNTGICYQLSEVKLREISDGTSNTYMVCERNLNPDYYYTGVGPDDDGMCVGFDNDSCREAYRQPLTDTPGLSLEDRFGSAHSAVWQAALCDGSVRALSYSIDIETHQRLGNREDGLPVDWGSN